MKSKSFKYQLSYFGIINRYINYGLVFLLLFVVSKAGAQVDTNYIIKYPEKLCFTTSLNDRVYRLTVTDANDKSNKVNYASNAGMSYGFGIDYKWLSLEYQHSFKQDLNNDLPANSYFSNFSLGFSGQQYWVRTFYQHQKGLFLDNHSGLDWPGGTDPEIYRDDIVCNTLFISGNYIFNNKKYSHSASSYQVQRQVKSAGSFVAGLTLISNSITADTLLVPASYNVSIGENGKIIKGLANSIIPQAGYVYSFSIHRDFFIHLTAIPGINFVAFVKKLDNQEVVKGQETSGFFMEERIAMGYNGERFFGGLSTNGYIYTGSVQSNPIAQNHQYFRIFFGVRFNLKRPKFFPEKII